MNTTNKTAADILGLQERNNLFQRMRPCDIDHLASAGFLKRPDDRIITPEAQAVLDAAEKWRNTSDGNDIATNAENELVDAVNTYWASLAPKPTTCRADELRVGDVFHGYSGDSEWTVVDPYDARDGMVVVRNWRGGRGLYAMRADDEFILVSRAKDGDHA